MLVYRKRCAKQTALEAHSEVTLTLKVFGVIEDK